jgi:hypothetical protein
VRRVKGVGVDIIILTRRTNFLHNLVYSGQYIDDQSMTSTMNSQTMKESTTEIKDTTVFVESSSKNSFDEMNNNSTILIDASDVTESAKESETSPSLFSFSYTTDLDLITFPNEKDFRKEQWFNVNQTNRGNSYLFWRKINSKITFIKNYKDNSTYIIRSEGRCLRHMCHVKFQSNGSLSKNNDGCLSFILWTRGQPGRNCICYVKYSIDIFSWTIMD